MAFGRGFKSPQLHHHTLKAQLFQLGFSFRKSSMLTRTYANCLLRFLLSKLGGSGRFWPKSPRFFSLFSVPLLTIQEVTFNEINDLRGGGLQAEIGGR